MAKTQKYYRLGSRLPRYTTRLSAFQNGMYLTDQVIPEGYAKALINYDIDDTGTNIKPRRGRETFQVLDYADTLSLGPVTLTDYIYAYDKTGKEINSIEDIVLSYGMYTKMSDITSNVNITYKKPIYLCNLKRTQNTGELVKQQDLDEFWILEYNKNKEQFDKVVNEDLGYVAARTIENAYAFEKPFKGPVGRPIGVVANNELYTFAGQKPIYNEYVLTPENNTLTNFGKPDLVKLKLQDTDSGHKIYRNVITPRQLNAGEAIASGFNLLSPEPYLFNNEKGGTTSVLGIVPYDPKDHTTPALQLRVGDTVDLHITYQYPNSTSSNAKVKFKIEELNVDRLDDDGELTDADWTLLSDWGNETTLGDDFYYKYTTKYTNAAVRVSIRLNDETTTEVPYWTQIRCNVASFEDLEFKKFDFSTCKGMINWQGAIGVYGVDTAPETLFFSDTVDPSYFPFPYNVMTFDNEILAVHNYLDYLLVITVDSIYLIQPGTTIQTSIQKRILTNLNIPEIDAINLVVLKDQIFFKTDTQFYVLKPNQYTSDATDLKNYTNSTAVANFTSNFQVETINLLNEVFKEQRYKLTKQYKKDIVFEDFDVLDTRSIVREEEVHYIYTIVPKLTDNINLGNLNLHMVYNTLSRTWRLYFVAIGNDNVFYAPILYKNKQSGVYYEFIPYATDYLTCNLVITKQTYDTVTDNVEHENWNLTTTYNNFPYIDTGNISVTDVDIKRFREVQFKLVNMEKTMIKFFADFKVDGREEIHATNFKIEHITDENDSDYGKIFVIPIEEHNMFLPGMNTLADNISEDEYMALDISKFPKLDVATVRFELRGRGYRGSLQLLNTSLKRYQLADVSWVYRNMSAR